MSTRFEYNYNSNNNSPFGGIVGLIIGVFLIIGLFWFVQFLFRILWAVFPFFLIATAILDYKVLVNYGKWVVKLFQRSWIAGAAIGFLSVVGAPLVTLMLFGRALFNRRVKQVKGEAERQQQGEYTDFEELDSEVLELPELETRKETPRSKPPADDNEYEQLFDE